MKWQINNIKKIKVKNFYLIEGLPGMGNVGKMAVDFIIENLKAEKIMEIHSYTFPHCVFVNENNLVELPSINIYQKVMRKKSFVFVAGDIQPIDEISCYEFCNLILDTLEKHKIKEIITLGGIGQHQIPKSPKIYCTGNNKDIIKRYSSGKIDSKIYGIVGPIIGVSGLLLGTSAQRKIPAVTLLAETYGNPAYLGIKGARELIKALNDKFKLNLNIRKISEEIEALERDIKTRKLPRSILSIKNVKKKDDINYIG
ncbi:MAG: PAC2 family protein [Nanoarchaeota archaeon]